MLYPKKGLPRIRIGFSSDAPELETRRMMIESTNRYLSRMLGSRRRVPRIPRTRMDQGGFDWIQGHRGVRALVEHFWNRLLGQ